MSKLIRFINQSIHDFFICNGEYFGDCGYQFENRLLDSFADCQLMAVLLGLAEEFANSFVVHKSLHGREDVILECHEGRTCNLCCEVSRLAFVKPQQSLALLHQDYRDVS